MKLFEEYPYIEGERLIAHKMTQADAPALQIIADNPRIYRYEPTFLYEQKYADARDVIANLDRECFDTHESILLGIYTKENPDQLIGIAEIYNYEEKKAKASFGYRFDESVWGKGYASEMGKLLRDYLMTETDLRTITTHIMKENAPSAKSITKWGFLKKYPNLYGDWGYEDLVLTDKYVFKRAWLKDGSHLDPVDVEQFVMAYMVEQDRLRAMMPQGFCSLRPVLRINTEIRDDDVVYAELNTPVEYDGRRGWLNIANCKSSSDDVYFVREGQKVTIRTPHIVVNYTGTGLEGGCPAEKDNDGCFYAAGGSMEFRPAEIINENKEFCDCDFAWTFEGGTHGASMRETLPAHDTPAQHDYPHCELTVENAAVIPCEKVLGAYIVRFERVRGEG